ncbi:MAG TPA: hypothetical protein VFT47_13775 [Vicinamibacterales bacterium]|nr:hypothetical protein [Vicinamibacterales bacterium]
MRLLLVEDEPRAAQMLAQGLREQAYAVDVARNGNDALYQAARLPPEGGSHTWMIES